MPLIYGLETTPFSHQLPKQNWNWFKFSGILEFPPISRVKNWVLIRTFWHVNHFNMKSEDSEIISSVSWWFLQGFWVWLASRKMMSHTGQPPELAIFQKSACSRESRNFFFFMCSCSVQQERKLNLVVRASAWVSNLHFYIWLCNLLKIIVKPILFHLWKNPLFSYM